MAYYFQFVSEANQNVPEFLKSVVDNLDFHFSPMTTTEQTSFDPNSDPWVNTTIPAPIVQSVLIQTNPAVEQASIESSLVPAEIVNVVWEE